MVVSWASLRPAPAVVRLAAASAAGVLAVSSNGDLVTFAVLVAISCGTAWSGVAVALAGAAVVVRWGSLSLSALAGTQAVLGPAVTVGPATAAASAGAAGAAVLLATRQPPSEVLADRRAAVALALVHAVAPAAGAAAIAVGPGPGGDLGLRVAATVALVPVAAAGAVARARWRRVDATLAGGALAAGTAALALAVVGS